MKSGARIVVWLILFMWIPLFGWSLAVAPGGGTVIAYGEEIDEREPGLNVSCGFEAEIWEGFSYGLRYQYSVSPATVIDTLNVDFKHHTFQLTNIWSPGFTFIEPYVRGGIGLYSWKELSSDTLVKAVAIDPGPPADTTINDLRAISFGLSIGGGLRICPLSVLELRFGIDYDLIFNENRELFGTLDSNENLLRFGVEFLYRLPLRK